MQELKYDNEKITRYLPIEIANSYRNIGFKSVAALRRRQHRNLKFIKKVYSRALHIKDVDKNLYLPVHFEWLCDNYYIVAREIKYVCRSLASIRKLPSMEVGKSDTHFATQRIYPRIYTYLYELTEKLNGELNGEILEDYMQSAQLNGNYFCIDELQLTGVMLSAVLNEKIYHIVSVMNDYIDKKVTSLSDEMAYEIGYAIKNLRFCSVYQFERLFSKCSKIDELFENDPYGAYIHMDKKTKDYYRYRLSLIARKKKINEIDAAEEILKKSAEQKKIADLSIGIQKIIHEKKSHVGYYLMQKKTPKTLYFFNITILTLLLTTFSVYTSNFWAILLVFPIWEFAKQFTDFIFSRSIGATPVPKLKISSVPDDKKTLVCVTTLLFGEGKDDKLFERLELFYHCNKDKNIKFAIVGDFKDNKDAVTEKDKEIIGFAKKKIEELNSKYDNMFALFVRKRVYSKTQNRYTGWERKRGAIIELVRFIKNINTTIDTSNFIGDTDFIHDVKYVITLDADTNLSMDSAKEMIAAMAHPNAIPVFDEKKKIVTDGYGLMQPRMGTELSAATKTFFTRMLCGSGGIDIYESAAFDLYQEIYKEGNFCGKGIFDVDMFYKSIDGAYPEDTILSHDLLEGTRLRTSLISDLELTDGIPKNAISYYDRLHRWIRGDIQAMFFAFGKVKNADGDIVPNPINALSKFKILDNVRRSATPIISVIFLILSVFLLKDCNILALAAISVLYIVFPLIAGMAGIFLTPSFQNVSKKFSSKVMTSIWQSLIGIVFEFSALGYKAVLSADAFIRTIWRKSVTKKQLLSWQTASESELNLKGLPLYIRKSIISMILGTFILIFVPFGFFKVLGALWIAFPFIVHVMGTESENSPTFDLDTKQNKDIKNYVTDMWKFYHATVKKYDNFLPPDNIQLYPVEVTAHRTSPTNIGLYLLSCLAAHDFGLIDAKTLCTKIDNTLTTIEKMEKWNGHLYNWYDTKSLEVIGSRFVSTVDSGNFAACLTALKEGLYEYQIKLNDNNLGLSAKRAEKILEEMNFTILYNPVRDLFYIGYDDEKKDFGSNCYDLYMSEAKITSYFAIARREVPKKHWGKLSRTLIKDGGYMGLASWTGTAFEYFMANLLLPLYKDSLTYEAHRFALREQIKRRAKYNNIEVWGISESGFYAFDFDMNYQYQAFGVQKLGLKRGLNKDLVISPYSSFLAMSISPKHALSNLKRLKKLGMYGKYGFYEAVDFTRSRINNGMGIVKSYMAHHVGMSIISCANLVKNNVFQQRYMSDKIQWSANELLQEKIPVDSIIFEDINKHEIPEKVNRSYASIKSVTGSIDYENPVCNLISNTKTKAITSSLGHIMFQDENKTLNYCNFFNYYDGLKSLAVLFKVDNEIFTTTQITFTRENAEYIYNFSDSVSVYSVKETVNEKCVIGEMKVGISPDTSCFSIDLSINVKNVKNSNSSKEKETEATEIETLLYFEPVITNINDYSAHPAFSSLSIECEFEREDSILIFKRRPRLENEGESYIAIDSVHNKAGKSEIEFESRRDEILPHAYETEDIKNLFNLKFNNTTGACINPVCAIKSKAIKQKSSSKYEVSFNISAAKSKEDAVNILKANRLKNPDKEMEKLKNAIINRQAISKLTQSEKSLYDIIISGFYSKTLYNKPDTELLSESYKNNFNGSVKSLWKEGISGDFPVILIFLSDEKKVSVIEEYLHVYRYLTLSGQKADLIVVYKEKEKYNRPSQNKIHDLIKRNSCENYLNRKGGIYLLNFDDLTSEQITLLKLFSSHTHEITETSEIKEIDTAAPSASSLFISPVKKYKYNNSEISMFTSEEPVWHVSGGYFTENTFVTECENKKAPWSHILTNRQFGTLVTQSSLGFTWCTNARERRLTPWENDSVSDMKGERLILHFNGEKYDVILSSAYFVISCNRAEYYGKIHDFEYKITVFTDEKLFIKITECEFTNVTNKIISEQEVALSYFTSPVMGVKESKHNTIAYYTDEREKDTIHFRNICNADFSQFKGFVKAIDGEIRTENDTMAFFCDSKVNYKENNCAVVFKNLNFNNTTRIQKAVFVLGCYKSEKNYKYIAEKLKMPDFTTESKKKSQEYIKNYIPKIKLKSEDIALNVMFNTWLPYQNLTGRIFARTGFYQSSGAYGFRDQLQDMMGVLYSYPDMVKEHIQRASVHQFKEGDVQHWWHEIKSSDNNLAHRGVRTRCSDDYLWLVYVTAKYIKVTGDYGILETKTAYIEDAPLEQNEQERYGEPRKSSLVEPIFEHCIKSVEYGLKYGSHGLPLMGNCDWNDGMSLVGAKGKGESVWLAFFLIMVLEEFIPLCKYKNRLDLCEKYQSESDRLRENIETHCFEETQYIRGFYDDGKKLGSKDNDECHIDLLPQAFAAITNTNIERTKTVLNSAYYSLYDEKARILKLFTPPFVDSEQEPGYIKGYVAGIRENGGQYTHAAVWGALGFLSAGETDKGYEIIKAINPARKCQEKSLAMVYKIEPYVLSGDVYSNENHLGRGGWSWYTGAAAWYYRVILENLLGVKVESGNITAEPKIPSEWSEFNLEIDLGRKYMINAKKDGNVEITEIL